MMQRVAEIARQGDPMRNLMEKIRSEGSSFARMAQLAETVAGVDKVVRQVEAYMPSLPKMPEGF